MAWYWGIALVWSRRAHVSNSGNSKSRCSENPCCCLQRILQGNLHFHVPRQNKGIRMYVRLAHKLKRKPFKADWKLRKKMFTCRMYPCKNKPQQLFYNNCFSYQTSNTIFVLSKIFLMGGIKQLSAESLCPATGVFGEWMERLRKNSSKFTFFLCMVHVQPHLGHQNLYFCHQVKINLSAENKQTNKPNKRKSLKKRQYIVM